MAERISSLIGRVRRRRDSRLEGKDAARKEETSSVPQDAQRRSGLVKLQIFVMAKHLMIVSLLRRLQ